MQAMYRYRPEGYGVSDRILVIRDSRKAVIASGTEPWQVTSNL